MRLTSTTIPAAIAHAADLVDRAAASYLAGGLAIERTDLSGTPDEWRPRFHEAVRGLVTPWRAGDTALADALAAVAALDQADPRVVEARSRITGGQRFVRHGYDYVGQLLMRMPSPLTHEYAKLTTGRIGAAGRTIDSHMRDAAAAIRLLAATA